VGWLSQPLVKMGVAAPPILAMVGLGVAEPPLRATPPYVFFFFLVCLLPHGLNSLNYFFSCSFALGKPPPMAKPPSFFFSCSFALGFGQTTPMGYRGGSATPRPVKGATISFFFFFFIFL